MRRIGILMAPDSDPIAQARLSALVQGLREFGWTEGHNLRIELRRTRSGGIDRIRAAAAELVASNTDLLWATGTPIVQELQRQTRTIPIVFASIGDPVDTGIVGSLARPGGNATGFSNWEPAMGGKRLALQSRAAPDGNTLLMASPDLLLASHLRKLNYDPPLVDPSAILINASAPPRRVTSALS